MARTQKQLDNLKKGKPFKKGQSGNSKGRPPKITTQLKKQGLSESQISDIAKEMLAMTIDELKVVAQKPNSTAYEVMLASAIRIAIQKGDISQIFGHVLHRLFGQPKQELDLTQKQIVWNETKTYEKSDKKK